MNPSAKNRARLKWASILIVIGGVLVWAALAAVSMMPQPARPFFRAGEPDCRIVKTIVGCRYGCIDVWGEDINGSYGIVECRGEPFYDHLKEKGCEIFEEQEVCGFTS